MRIHDEKLDHGFWEKALGSGLAIRLCNHTFHKTREGVIHNKVGPDFHGETFPGLKEKEEKQYGEYLTSRLVLEAWDKLEAR